MSRPTTLNYLDCCTSLPAQMSALAFGDTPPAEAGRDASKSLNTIKKFRATSRRAH